MLVLNFLIFYRKIYYALVVTKETQKEFTRIESRIEVIENCYEKLDTKVTNGLTSMKEEITAIRQEIKNEISDLNQKADLNHLETQKSLKLIIDMMNASKYIGKNNTINIDPEGEAI